MIPMSLFPEDHCQNFERLTNLHKLNLLLLKAWEKSSLFSFLLLLFFSALAALSVCPLKLSLSLNLSPLSFLFMGRGAGRNNTPCFISPRLVPSHKQNVFNDFKFLVSGVALKRTVWRHSSKATSAQQRSAQEWQHYNACTARGLYSTLGVH